MQTSIRLGRYDFLLRKRDKNDDTPWNLIPPLQLDIDLPPIEIGLFKSLYSNNRQNDNIDRSVDKRDEDMDILEDDMSKDNVGHNKRNMSDNATKQSPMKRKIFRKSTSHQEGVTQLSSSDTESDTEMKSNRKLLNSTPIPTSFYNTKSQSDTLPQTPDLPTRQKTLSQNYIPISSNLFAPIAEIENESEPQNILTKQFLSSRKNKTVLPVSQNERTLVIPK